ncbi:MAG: peptide-binding protein, partial [Elusimicrobia bacterium]|nr:peptide-binding protein [Elusimicrobiota bacterium]MBD3412276.1 peptide-binding protein [Elusimicrobiota bacterium]
MNLLWKTIISLSLCLSVSGCLSSPSEHTTETFIDTSIGDASYLNPILATDTTSGSINDLVYNGLVQYDKNLVIVGDLAERWRVSRDGRTITFYLRKDVRWHDGEPFTARDVEFTYTKLIDPTVKTPYASKYLLVKHFTVIDAHTIRVQYGKPFAPALISWGMGILPEHIFRTGDFNTHPANRKPVGTGPFKFSEWLTDQRIVLTANHEYFEGTPGFETYILRIIPDQGVQFLELRNKTIDMMTLSPDMYYAYDEFFEHYNKFRYPAFSYT